MPCTIETPCGNYVGFFARRPDGVEIHHCLNGHRFLIGAPTRPDWTPQVTEYGDRACAAGPKCVGVGKIEAKRPRHATYCLKCEVHVTSARQRLLRQWPPKQAGCLPCKRSGLGPCVRHHGPSLKERKLYAYYAGQGRVPETATRCGACTLSLRNGHGPCTKHGGDSVRTRQLRSYAKRKSKRRMTPKQARDAYRPFGQFRVRRANHTTPHYV